jgi:hypothetical protein
MNRYRLIDVSRDEVVVAVLRAGREAGWGLRGLARQTLYSVDVLLLFRRQEQGP